MPFDIAQTKQRITEILDAKTQLKRLTSKPYEELTMEQKYAIRYHVIVIAEALGTMCMHVAREDLKHNPLSYSECFSLLDKEGITENSAQDLTKLVRLRNLLTHRYWAIDDNQVYNSIKSDFTGVDSFLECVKDKYAINV